jgi:raffinose/stachyose/melibiose transport system substrate-binding protein
MKDVFSVARVVLVACFVAGLTAAWAQQSVTLTFWTQLDDPSEMASMEQLVAEFEEANPGVTVALTPMPREEMDSVLRLTLGAGEGPDMADFDVGDAFLGALARSGLVYDMTEAYAARGWDERVYGWAQDAVSYDGALWAVPYQQEAQGIWYNAAIFSDLGLEPPTTWDNFIAAATAAREAGIVPISHGTATLATAPQLLANIVYGLIPADVVTDASTLSGNSTWRDDPRFLEAVETFVQWIEDGWLPASPNALSFPDYQQFFLQGNAAMAAIGPWSASAARAAWQDGVVEPLFLPMPAQDTTFPLTNQGAPGSAMFIKANIAPGSVEHALDFLDHAFIRSESQLMWLMDHGILPVTDEEIDPDTLGPVLSSVWEAHDYLGERGGTSGMWLDHYVSPEAAEVFNNGQARLVAGVWTPQEFVDAISDAAIRAREQR